ncbi:cytidine deaminase-like protein [Chloropicon primus]|uniref:Cytidine deaminase-like protein n=2 Tax=Chloropicon primus TaxID=1764295 RepID=A0A5B8MXC5_9CHLO|nr:cytidine deaminase-like protein [Chloropicon primus]UPR03553.1 cytidine deaminase-like protein [Chloropicon primus]|eukprot:QDZ24345.1 cytidine deaminase-like protein [Chloropicon primus]
MEFGVAMPDWAEGEQKKLPEYLKTLEERMRVVHRFARLNVEHDTGGPFAAGVFELKTGRVVSIGVNRVVPGRCSTAHAEVMAIALAQKRLGVHDLGGEGLPDHQLVVNWLPCCMCFGATLWSGVTSLAIAGSDGSLEEITGFDEGPRIDNAKELAKRGIEFFDNILKDEAIDTFKLFRDSGRLVYNGRGGGACIPVPADAP